MSTSVTKVRYPFAPSGALVSTAWLPTVSWPQSASATRPDDTGWPSATRFVTPLPLTLPPAPDGPVPADACALTASAVISPLKIEMPVTTLSARAPAFLLTSVVAFAVDDDARTIVPSDGYPKLSTAGLAAGGETTVDVPTLVPPAGDTWTPQAVAAAPGVRAGPTAAAGPIRSRVTGSSRARRRTVRDSARPGRSPPSIPASDDLDAPRVGRHRAAVHRAEHLDPAESRASQQLRVLRRGVHAVIEPELPPAPVLQEGPERLRAPREQIVPPLLEPQRAVGELAPGPRPEPADERRLVHGVEDKHAARPQHPRDLGELPLVLGLRVEVAERRPDVDGAVEEGVLPRELAHVAAPEVQLRRREARDLERALRDVETVHLETALGHRHRDPAGPAREVEHPASGRELRGHERRLLLRALGLARRREQQPLVRLEERLVPAGVDAQPTGRLAELLARELAKTLARLVV